MIHSFGLIYSGLCTFSPYLSPSASQSLPSLWWYLSRFVRLCVHVDKEPSPLSCLTAFHHLSNWSLCYKTFSFASRGVQRRTKCSATLLPPQRTRCHKRGSFIYRSCPAVPDRQLPHAPENPTAVLSTSEKRAIDLAWAKPFDGNSPLIRYILEVSENSKSRNTQSCIQWSHPSICALCPLCQFSQL